MKQLCLSVLILSLSVLSQCRYTNCPDPYKYNILSLSWLGEFCSEHQCNNLYDEWDQKTITIHGLWPSPRFKGRHDPNTVHYCHENVMECQEGYLMGFNYNLLMENDTQLKADLERLWPQANARFPLGGFYQHEYEKHGVCYIQHMINQNRQAYEQDKLAFQKEMFKAYFRTAIELTKRLNYEFFSGQEFQDKGEFAKKLGLKSGQFTYQCRQNDGQIDELRVCFSVADTPGVEQIVSCEGYENDECRRRGPDDFSFK